jgi:predicted amidohydrolase YtcJ
MLPAPTPEEEVSSLMHVIHDLNRFGLTSVLDATSIIGYPEGHTPLQTLVRENR